MKLRKVNKRSVKNQLIEWREKYMAQTLMAIDAGTGSVRAVLFDLEGNQLGCVQHEWTHREDPRYPGSMDFEWEKNWKLASDCVRGVLKETGVDPQDVAAVSTTCMR